VTYFSHARTALKSGLIILGFRKGDKILIPEYICDALIQPLNNLGIVPVYYPVDDKLEPLWERLEQLAHREPCRAIVMVHFFGQEQYVSHFQRFCETHNLVLIEDNAHGFGGRINGRLLGTFGDIGVVSPRKILNTKYGGQLYISGVLQSTQENMAKNTPQIFYWAIKSLLTQWPTIRNRFFRLLGRIPDVTHATSFKEPEVEDKAADWFSSWMIDRVIQTNRIDLIAKKRRQKWESVNRIVVEQGGSPVFAKVSNQSSPWAYPFYTNSNEQRERIKNCLFNKGYTIFPWPALPAEVLAEVSHGSALDRWHRLLCVAL